MRCLAASSPACTRRARACSSSRVSSGMRAISARYTPRFARLVSRVSSRTSSSTTSTRGSSGSSGTVSPGSGLLLGPVVPALVPLGPPRGPRPPGGRVLDPGGAGGPHVGRGGWGARRGGGEGGGCGRGGAPEPLAQPQPDAVVLEVVGGDERADGDAVAPGERAERVAPCDGVDAVGRGIRRRHHRRGEEGGAERAREQPARGRHGSKPAKRTSKPAKRPVEGIHRTLTVLTWDSGGPFPKARTNSSITSPR